MIFQILWAKHNILLKLIHLFIFSFNVATREFKIIHVAHILFLGWLYFYSQLRLPQLAFYH